MRLLAVSLLVAASACHSLWPDDDLVGDGHLIEVRPPVTPFTGIEVTNSFIVDLRIGDPEVVMTLDQNIVESNLVVVAVRDGILVVDQCAGCRDFAPSAGAALRIATPIIDTIRATGLTTVSAQANGTQLSIDATGDSRVAVAAVAGVSSATAGVREDGVLELSGALPQLTVRASGDGTLRSMARSVGVDVAATDLAHVDVHASASAQVYARGISVVTVVGGPRERTIDAADEAVVRFP